ncbi:hypothetical protein HFO98_02835 [Rhizobium leguminosarum]|uniref:hypothetical protein n=1 Tax=Rhizobium leguminosarum TaxID=384 RepID=UPI001C978652|nr:hypothetical protein [Rhizobium leguminosarum]MBY5407416.1 hypothetical protein [Rhizobium leguminosarum]
MKMKKDEMPFRLRELLPKFGPDRKAKYWEQIEGMADFLGKQPRTVEAYASYSEDRTVSADDYWRVVVEWVKRKSRSTAAPAFLVLDDNGDQLYETQWPWQAMFLADVEGTSWGATPRGVGQMRFFTAPAGRRSRLRRLVRDDIIGRKIICAMFDFDEHCLVDYQLEGVGWLSTPDEMRLQMLEHVYRAQTSAAA